MIIGTGYERQILHRSEEDQGPNDQRENPENSFIMLANSKGEAFAKRVDNGSPNVTIDNTQRSQGA